MYYIYVWSIVNGEQRGECRDAGDYAKVMATAEVAKTHRFNYRIIRNSRVVEEKIF